MARYSHRPNQIKRRDALYLRACFSSGVRRCLDYRRARTRTGAGSGRNNPSGAGYQASGGATTIKAGEGGIQPKRQGQGSPQKNLGTKSAKPFPLPKCFGFQKIFRKNFGKMKRGFVSKGRIFWVCGKNLSGVRLFDCYYLSHLLGK